jgi:hypothetical protein
MRQRLLARNEPQAQAQAAPAQAVFPPAQVAPRHAPVAGQTASRSSQAPTQATTASPEPRNTFILEGVYYGPMQDGMPHGKGKLLVDGKSVVTADWERGAFQSGVATIGSVGTDHIHIEHASKLASLLFNPEYLGKVGLLEVFGFGFFYVISAVS